jgi:hypothetical protein
LIKACIEIGCGLGVSVACGAGVLLDRAVAEDDWVGVAAAVAVGAEACGAV